MTAVTTDQTVRKTIMVRRSVEDAFRLFTEEIGSWWPTGTHSIYGKAVETVIFEPRSGGEVFERARDGKTAHWATVLEYDPPNRFVLEWKVNPEAAAPTEVEVRFVPDGGSTRVELEHRGWERLGADAEASYASYDTGWDHVLAGLERAAA